MSRSSAPPVPPCRLGRLCFGAVLAAGIAGLALLSAVWTPFDPEKVQILARLRPPSPEHWLGTDHFGRDVLSMLMTGGRHSLAIAAASVAAGLGGGVPLGLAASAFGGWTDEAVSRLADLLFAFPALLTALVLAAALGPGPDGAVIAMGVFNAAVLTRVTRGAAGRIWRREYILAAAALGRSRFSIAWVHVLPGTAGVVTVQAASLFAVAILNEAALSYLGLGIQPPSPSWGRMLSDAQPYLFTHPIQAVFPGVAIAATVLGLTLLGDALGDRLDPRHSATPPL